MNDYVLAVWFVGLVFFFFTALVSIVIDDNGNSYNTLLLIAAIVWPISVLVFLYFEFGDAIFDKLRRRKVRKLEKMTNSEKILHIRMKKEERIGYNDYI